MTPFHGGVKPGQRVKYRAYMGAGMRGPEYKDRVGKATLVYTDRIVINAGGRHGRPVVVTESNFSGLA